MAGLPAAQGDQRHAAVAAEEPKKSRKRRPAEGDGSIDNPDEDEQENLGKGNKYKCRFCDQWFQKSQALGGHMNKHRQEREQETLHKAEVLISDMQHRRHMPVSTQGYMNMYGQLSATEIAQRSSGMQARGAQSYHGMPGMQARGAQSYHGMPATASYYHSTVTGLHANTSFLATQHFNPLMPTNFSNNHVQQQNPGNAQPWNIDNTMSLNHGPRVASAFADEPTANSYHHHSVTNEMIQILDSSPSTPPIHESYH